MKILLPEEPFCEHCGTLAPGHIIIVEDDDDMIYCCLDCTDAAVVEKKTLAVLQADFLGEAEDLFHEQLKRFNAKVKK